MRNIIIRTLAYVVAFGVFVAPAFAKDGLKAVGYNISTKSPEVTGRMVVNGYSYAQIMAFIASDCADGRIGQFALVGKPKKRRGLLLQSFVTSCASGPHARFQNTKSVTIEVERTPAGQNLAEFTYGVNGDILYERAYK
ncbi:MAG: hypothetical protein ABJG55_18270 [Paracoccaceae bacterium]